MRQQFLYIFFTMLFCLGVKGWAHDGFAIKEGIDTGKINRLIDLGDDILDPDSAIATYSKAIALSKKGNYAEGVFTGLMDKGLRYSVKEDYVKSRNNYIEALHWAAGSTKKDALIWCYNNIGISYFSEGDYPLASEYYYKALGELKKMPSETIRTAANVYMNLGIINMRLGQTDQGLSFFQKAENVARKGGFDYQLAYILINKGEYYIPTKPDSAITFFNELMDISKKMDRLDLQAMANNDLGKAFIEKGAYDKGVSYLEESIELSKNRFNDVVINSSLALGDVWYRTHKYKDAESTLLLTLKEATDHNIKDIYSEVYAKLADVYRATGQYKKALECTDSVLALKTRLTSTENAKAINQMEIKYKTAEKDRQIATNELLIARQKSNIVQKNIWITIIVSSIFLGILISIILYRNVRHKERLQEEQIRSLTQENRISVLKALVEGEEKERGRIAAELHDGIGGLLSAAIMRFNAMHHDNQEITKIPAYHEVMHLLDDIGDQIRKTAHNLMPEVLLKQPLPDAVRTYCNYVQEGKGIQIDFQSYGDLDDLPHDLKLNVYRILQELLKNITQHAHAKNALVQLLKHEQLLTITVEDDGIGFDTTTIKKGIGLYNLQTRVSSLGGQFTLSSDGGMGTSVYIEIEVKEAAPKA